MTKTDLAARRPISSLLLPRREYIDIIMFINDHTFLIWSPFIKISNLSNIYLQCNSCHHAVIRMRNMDPISTTYKTFKRFLTTMHEKHHQCQSARLYHKRRSLRTHRSTWYRNHPSPKNIALGQSFHTNGGRKTSKADKVWWDDQREERSR